MLYVRSTCARAQATGRYPYLSTLDGKAEVDDYVRKLGLPAVFIRLGCFNDNMIKFEFVTKNENGNLTINIPHAQYEVKNSQSQPARV